MNDRQQNRALQYDLCQRYELLARMLEAAFPDGPVRVLDVGAGSSDLSRAFLPDRFVITLADTDTFGRADITLLQPGEPLPFPDRAFDAVLAMDVLEHVPPADRDSLVRDLARTAAAAVVLSHPDANPAVVEAERVLLAAHEGWFRSGCRFLDEHAEHGLPATSVAVNALAASGLRPAHFANCPLVDWLPFTVLDVALLAQFGTGGPKDAFNLAANELAGGLHTAGAHYRTFVVGTRAEDMLRRITAAVANGQRERGPDEDRAIAQLMARTIVQFADNPRVAASLATIVGKDEHIAKLEVLLQQQASGSETAIAAKDEHIRKLGLLLDEERARLMADIRTILHAKDEHIRKLELLLHNRPTPRR